MLTIKNIVIEKGKQRYKKSNYCANCTTWLPKYLYVEHGPKKYKHCPICNCRLRTHSRKCKVKKT
jgi:hypothetical protein